jgi:flavodoxin
VSLLIVCGSKEHGNTRKLADAMAAAVAGTVVTAREANAELIAKHEVVAFGTGVRFMRPYAEVLQAVDRLPRQEGKKALVFSTSGFGWRLGHAALRQRLVDKGFQVAGELACKGLDTMGPLWLLGGVNKGRPNADDLRRAADLARRVAPPPPTT